VTEVLILNPAFKLCLDSFLHGYAKQFHVWNLRRTSQNIGSILFGWSDSGTMNTFCMIIHLYCSCLSLMVFLLILFPVGVSVHDSIPKLVTSKYIGPPLCLVMKIMCNWPIINKSNKSKWVKREVISRVAVSGPHCSKYHPDPESKDMTTLKQPTQTWTNHHWQQKIE